MSNRNYYQYKELLDYIQSPNNSYCLILISETYDFNCTDITHPQVVGSTESPVTCGYDYIFLAFFNGKLIKSGIVK